MTKVILFDIDGTLILTGGAGMRGMDRAFAQAFSIRNAFDGVAMPGRTDRAILADALRASGIEPTPEIESTFRSTYLLALAEEMTRADPRKRVMPGVTGLLEELVRRAGIFVGLLSGNYAEAARIKLEYFDLWRHFAWGAFGDDAADRNHLLPIAVERARDHGVPTVAADDVIVVGDTPLDVECARSAGATAVAVATGPYDAATLRRSGAQAVLEDLSGTAVFLELLERRG